MNRRPNKELYDFLIQYASDRTVSDLLPLVNELFEENYDRLHLQKYLIRNRIPYKYEYPTKVRNMNNLPIGSERIMEDGSIYIKIAHNRWTYKQRYIYEKLYNVKLKEDDYIVCLDGDKTNFSKENLYKMTRWECAHLANFGHFKGKPELRKLACVTAKSITKTKNIELEMEE